MNKPVRTPVEVDLTDEQRMKLNEVAVAREQSLGDVLQRAVEKYLEDVEAYRAYVQVGLDDVAAGRTRPWEDVKAEMRAKYGNFGD